MTMAAIIRDLLRHNPDGLSTSQIAEHLNRPSNHIHKTLRLARGIRVIRWVRPGTVGRPRAIWGLGFGNDEPPPLKKKHRPQKELICK